MKYITYVSDVTHKLDVVTPNFNNISDLFKHLILPDYNTELTIQMNRNNYFTDKSIKM